MNFQRSASTGGALASSPGGSTDSVAEELARAKRELQVAQEAVAAEKEHGAQYRRIAEGAEKERDAQLRLSADADGPTPEEDGLLGAPALKRGRSLGKVEFLPEGDDDELDYVFDSDGDDACVPIERLVDALSPTKTKNQWDDKPQGVRRGVRRAVAAGVLLSFWPAGEALAVDAGATVPACVENQPVN